jgi:hypothetical protein
LTRTVLAFLRSTSETIEGSKEGSRFNPAVSTAHEVQGLQWQQNTWMYLTSADSSAQAQCINELDEDVDVDVDVDRHD